MKQHWCHRCDSYLKCKVLTEAKDLIPSLDDMSGNVHQQKGKRRAARRLGGEQQRHNYSKFSTGNWNFTSSTLQYFTQRTRKHIECFFHFFFFDREYISSGVRMIKFSIWSLLRTWNSKFSGLTCPYIINSNKHMTSKSSIQDLTSETYLHRSYSNKSFSNAPFWYMARVCNSNYYINNNLIQVPQRIWINLMIVLHYLMTVNWVRRLHFMA